MKLNFRKIASVLSSVVMVSSTVALAAAATAYPAPFIKSGASDVALVYGSAAGASLDLSAVTDLSNDLKGEVTVDETTSSTTTVTGESFQLHRAGSDELNLGDEMNDFYTNINKDKLPTVLADGIYTNYNGDDFDYEQKITMGTKALSHFLDKDFNDEKPAIGFAFVDGDLVLNYTLDFKDKAEGGTDFEDLGKTEINLLGKTYYIATVTNASNTPALTLLDTANSVTLKEGESTTVTTADEQSFDISLNTVNDGGVSDDKATLVVGGKTYSNLFPGNTRKIAENVYLSVSEVIYSDKKDSSMQFSVGNGKIYIEDGQEVEVNDESVSGIDKYNSMELLADVEVTGDKVSSIVLSWKIGEDTWLAPDSELVMPAFESIKLTMSDFVTSEYEKTTFESNSDESLLMKAQTTDGLVNIDLAYASATAFLGQGKDSTTKLVVNSTGTTINLNVSEDSYFVATWISSDEAESHVYQIASIKNTSSNTVPVVKLNNLATDGSDIELTDFSDIQDAGSQMQITLNSASVALGTATVTISSSGNTEYADRLVTKDGLVIFLPMISTSVTNYTWKGGLDPTNGNYSAHWITSFYEEDKDDVIMGGANFTVDFGVTTSDGPEPVDTTVTNAGGITTYPIEDGSETEEGYRVSDLATKVLLTDPTSGSNTLEIYYPSGESYAEVFVAESGAVTSSSGGTTTVGVVSVTDAEVSSVSGKNLIVVGGACVNSYAATLLGSATPMCGTAWETATGVGTGKFLIQTFALTGDKVATLVAGYDASDTTNAATKLRTDSTIDITTGKKYTGNLQNIAMVTVA